MIEIFFGALSNIETHDMVIGSYLRFINFLRKNMNIKFVHVCVREREREREREECWKYTCEVEQQCKEGMGAFQCAKT